MRLILAAIILAGLCAAQPPAPIPDNLKPLASEKLFRQVHAEGDQVYTCDGSGWVLIRPDAKLLDESGRQIGSHYAGPTWEWADGSRVVGRPIANATPDPDSIPWLLLTATDHQGDGLLKRVSSIQRLFTKGGKASAAGCDAAHKAAETRVRYTAIYRFYIPGE